MPVAAGGFGPGGKKWERNTGESQEGLSYPGGKSGGQMGLSSSHAVIGNESEHWP